MNDELDPRNKPYRRAVYAVYLVILVIFVTLTIQGVVRGLQENDAKATETTGEATP